jgi:hypothetical protein
MFTLSLLPNLTFAALNHTQTCIILYEKEHYKGKHIRICKNTPDLKTHHFNDKARSVKVEGKGSVTLYENKNYKGSMLDIKGNSKEDYVDPITSSIKFHN